MRWSAWWWLEWLPELPPARIYLRMPRVPQRPQAAATDARSQALASTQALATTDDSCARFAARAALWPRRVPAPERGQTPPRSIPIIDSSAAAPIASQLPALVEVIPTCTLRSMGLALNAKTNKNRQCAKLVTATPTIFHRLRLQLAEDRCGSKS